LIGNLLYAYTMPTVRLQGRIATGLHTSSQYFSCTYATAKIALADIRKIQTRCAYHICYYYSSLLSTSDNIHIS